MRRVRSIYIHIYKSLRHVVVSERLLLCSPGHCWHGRDTPSSFASAYTLPHIGRISGQRNANFHVCIKVIYDSPYRTRNVFDGCMFFFFEKCKDSSLFQAIKAIIIRNLFKIRQWLMHFTCGTSCATGNVTSLSYIE